MTSGRNETVVHIWTSNPVHVRRLRKDTRVSEVRGGDDWGLFTVPVENYDPMRGLKSKRVMSPEQRAASGARLRAAREARL